MGPALYGLSDGISMSHQTTDPNGHREKKHLANRDDLIPITNTTPPFCHNNNTCIQLWIFMHMYM